MNAAGSAGPSGVAVGAGISCVVADDEPLAAARVARLAEGEGLRVRAVCATGAEALAAVAVHAPEVAFLDVRMPGMTGLEVVERLAAMPRPPTCVLVTAHDEHAVAAFALAAVDYVLKPVARERFAAAVARARETLEARDAADQLARLRGALAAPRPDRIALRDGGRVLWVDPGEVARVEGADDHAALHACGRVHLLPVRLAALEQLLPHPPFLRCHRSHIVNLHRVERLEPLGCGRLVLRVDGAAVPVSRPRAEAVRAALDPAGIGDRPR